MKDKVTKVLEELWSNYYNSDKKQIKPPTLDRITRLLATDDYLETRRQVKAILAEDCFVKIREKDNCGISWFCFCHKDSKYLQECLASKNRVA